MKTPEYFNLLVTSHKMRIRGAGWVRSAVVVIFVALIALFFTAPVDRHQQPYAKPMPASAGMQAASSN